MKKERFFKKLLNKIKKNKNLLLRCVTWIIIATLFLTIIQIIFTIPAQSKWLDSVWGADSLIVFVGTIVLGFVAIYQNIKANKLNANMQKLEEARFVSMISLTAFSTNYSNGKIQVDRHDYKTAESIDLADIDHNEKRIKLYTEFCNNSDFPIVSVSAVIGKADEYSQKFLCVNYVLDKPIYIPERNSFKFCFSIPYEHIIGLLKLYKNNSMPLTLMLSFENIFGYPSKAFIYLEIDKNGITHKYRLAKYTDIKPNEEDSYNI